MFVTESGNVHLCFLAEPVGNLYETPLAEIWNSPRALANRSRMISGRYLAATCSEPSCSWREGRTPASADRNQIKVLLEEMKDLGERAARLQPGEPSELPALSAVRRLLGAREQNSLELGALFRQLCETNSAVHERGREYIDYLESELRSARQEQSHLESELRAARQEHKQLLEQQRSPLVRIARRASRALDKLCLRPV